MKCNCTFVILLITIVFSSCISRKKTVLFQDGSKNMKYPSDKVQATFKPFEHTYAFKPGDIINISIGSITPSDFDFVNQYTVQMGEILYLSPRTTKNMSKTGSTVSTSSSSYNVASVSTTGSTPIADKQAYGFVIGEDGSIVLPKIGSLNIQGKTILETQKIIEDSLLGYFESPNVRVQILNFQFTVLGEVLNQGRYTTFKDKTTIVEALTMAGYFTEFADRANVKIVRTRNNETTVTYVNLLDDDILASQNYFIYPDDIIVIAPLKAKFWRQYVMPDISKAIGILSASLSVFVLVYTLNNK